MPSPRRSASFPIPGGHSIDPPSQALPTPPPDPNFSYYYSPWQGDEPYPLFPDAGLAPPYPGRPPSTYPNGPIYPPYDPYLISSPTQQEPSTLTSRLSGFLVILFALVFFPLYFLYAAAAYFFFGANVFNDNSDDGGGGGQVADPPGLYHKAQELHKTARREAMIVSAIWGRLVFVSLIWLVPNLAVPVLRNKTLLGSKLWQWTLLFMLVACGYPLVSVTTKVALLVVCYSDDFKSKKNALYFARGLRRSVNLIVLSGSALFLWVFHFRKATDFYPSLDKATWTLVSLFVGALMWFVKTALLLNWEADAVYRRFSERITRVGFQLYFVGLIYGRRFNEFQPYKGSQVPLQNDEADYNGDDPHDDVVQSQDRSTDHYQQEQVPQQSSANLAPEANNSVNIAVPMTSTTSHVWRARAAQRYPMSSAPASYGAYIATQQYPMLSAPATTTAVPMTPTTSETWRGRAYNSLDAGRYNKEREEKKRLAKEVLLSKRRKASKEATTYDIKQKANYFVNMYVLSSRDGDGFSDLLNMFSQKIPYDLEHITKEDLMNQFEFDVEDANLLYSDELQVEDSTVSYETFKKWMLKAHKNCIVLGYTLSDAKGVVSVLNKIMTGFLIIAVTVTWLLLAQIATTNLIVLIASPFLAAAFVFGETCRRIFEGIVFSFINHPFDVGDRCIIEGIELEVKHMGVLSTTFIKIGTREEALYPNSVLATKSITNLKGDPDPDDIVELTLDSNSTSKSALDALQSKINRFLETDPRYEHENSTGIVIKGIGNSIKMTVHYGHVLSIQEVTHTQCFEKKVKQRSQLLLKIKLFLDELDIKVATITL